MSQGIFFISAFRACSLFGSRVNQATSLHSLLLSLWVCVLLADDHEAHFFLQNTHTHLHTKTVRATLLIQCCLRLLILTVFCLSREILICCLYMCFCAITIARLCVCTHARTHRRARASYTIAKANIDSIVSMTCWSPVLCSLKSSSACILTFCLLCVYDCARAYC